MNLDFFRHGKAVCHVARRNRGRKRSPWLLTIYKSWDDPPSIHWFSSVEGPNKSKDDEVQFTKTLDATFEAGDTISKVSFLVAIIGVR